MREPLVIANWKMNPPTRREARVLFNALSRAARRVRGVSVAIAPPTPFLSLFTGRESGRITLAAQDLFSEERGAYTGATSPIMLRDLGVRAVVIGHSERRRVFGEDDATVNRKIRAAIGAKIIPVVAVGEDEAESGTVVPPTLTRQLEGALLGIPRRLLRGAIVAYEPVWAIGTGKAETPDNANRRAIYIRKVLALRLGHEVANSIRILYGGSVTAKNAASFIARDIRGMEGLLVGGASLKPDEFFGILRAVAGTGK